MLPMLKTIIASLFNPPVTNPIPAADRPNPGPLRGQVAMAVEQCVFCGLCGRCCPAGAIAVDRKEKTWRLDLFTCVVCGYCVDTCPKKCLRMLPRPPAPGIRAAREERLDARVPDSA